jgi:hypothetical protein
MNKDEQFRLFKRYCKKYIKLYKLFGWKITYRIRLTPFSKDEALIDCDINTREAVITLYKHNRYSARDIESAAFHEITHLLFADLLDEIEVALRGLRGLISKFKIRRKEHDIIEKLEAVLFKEYSVH